MNNIKRFIIWIILIAGEYDVNEVDDVEVGDLTIVVSFGVSIKFAGKMSQISHFGINKLSS